MKKLFSLAVLVVLTLALNGCLEFKRQTVYFRHDPGRDTLHIFQDYQGIFGSEAGLDLSSEEFGQLTSVMKGERTFFFGNWITEYNRETLDEARLTPAGELDENPSFEAAGRALINSALNNINVENIGFYFNKDDQLSGAQKVTVKNVSKVLADLNKLLLFIAREESEKDDETLEEQRLLRKFADSEQKTLQLKGNQLEVRWPIPESEYLRFKDRTPQGVAFKKSGGSMDYKDGVVILTMGQRDSKMVSLSMPVFDNPYVGNAVAEAKKYGINKSFNAERAAREFLMQAGAAKE